MSLPSPESLLKKKVPLNKVVEFAQECSPSYLRMGTSKIKVDKETTEKGQRIRKFVTKIRKVISQACLLLETVNKFGNEQDFTHIIHPVPDKLHLMN